MYQLRKIADLEVIEIPGEKGAPTVVLLHGYGADAQDLAPLSHVLKTPPGTSWLIPNGPLKIPIGPHHMGRAWSPINMEEWQRAMMEGRPRDLSNERPPELFKSEELILKMMEAYGATMEKTIFAGFSQGAMMATQLSMMGPVKPLGLIIFSGSLINAADWEKGMKEREGFKYFQSHGLHDEVLSIKGAEKLNKLFHSHHLQGDFVKFQGGHEIPPEALHGAQKYLETIFPDKSQWEEHH